MARILVVDDEAVNIKMLSRLLSSEGYEIENALDGKEAVAKTADFNPDLILLDVMMPGMDGFEVCRRLKSREATRRIPIVMITALDTLEDKIKGIEAGANDFLTKPYSKIELLARTRSLLKMKLLDDDFTHAYAHLTELNSYADRLFGTFDPFKFSLEKSLLDLMDQLLRKTPAEQDKPEYIFLSIGPSRERIVGRVYFRSITGEVMADPEPVALPLDAVMAFGDSGPDVAFSNWRDQAESIEEYQEFFPEKIKERVDLVRNYTSYQFAQVAITAYNYGKDVGPYDAHVLKAMAIHSSFLKTAADQVLEIEAAFLYTIETLARAAEALDEETGNHILRVNNYSKLVAKELGLPADFVRQIGYSAQMHDVGKIHINPNVLRKPGPLDTSEWTDMIQHTTYGARILGNHPRLNMSRRIALHHHEKYDGSGYPQGLKGEDISMEGRIVILADIYDALRSSRPYKLALDHNKASEIILKGDGRVMPSHFDPQVLDVYARRHDGLADIYETLQDKA